MVFGTGKNGKSTVLNALFGEKLLPSGTTTCTGNVTHISRVTNREGREMVRLHRRGAPHDTWESRELEPADAEGRASRVREEWVTDSSIDEIRVEYDHELLRHGITVVDVPGCAQCQCVSVRSSHESTVRSSSYTRLHVDVKQHFMHNRSMWYV